MNAHTRHPKLVIGPRWLAAMRELFSPPPETRVVDLVARSEDCHREIAAHLSAQNEKLNAVLARLESTQ